MIPYAHVRLENGLIGLLDEQPDGLYAGADTSMMEFLDSCCSGDQFLWYCQLRENAAKAMMSDACEG